MANPVNNYDDVIDSREVIERIDQLVAEEDNGPLSDGESAELTALRALEEEAKDYAEDWSYGVTLIRDSYFKTYAQELAGELDLVPADASWPNSCIDWEKAAWELRMDYTSVDFDGVTYWVR